MAKLDRSQSVVNQWVSAGNTTHWMCAKQYTYGASHAYVSECLVIVLSLTSHSSVQFHGPWKLADMHTGVSMDVSEIARSLPLLASVLKDDEMELWALLTQWLGTKSADEYLQCCTAWVRPCFNCEMLVISVLARVARSAEGHCLEYSSPE